MKQHNEQTKED